MGAAHDVFGNALVQAALVGSSGVLGQAVGEAIALSVGLGEMPGGYSSNSAMLRAMRRGAVVDRSVERAMDGVGESGGMALPDPVLKRMERAFGHDFGHVRVHTDGPAVQAARALEAHAFALGQHLFFGAGEFDPNTGRGDRLLAHELTHVLQHDEGRLRSPDTSGGVQVSNPSDAMEVEAYHNEGVMLDALQQVDRALATERAHDEDEDGVSADGLETAGALDGAVEQEAGPAADAARVHRDADECVDESAASDPGLADPTATAAALLARVYDEDANGALELLTQLGPEGWSAVVNASPTVPGQLRLLDDDRVTAVMLDLGWNDGSMESPDDPVPAGPYAAEMLEIREEASDSPVHALALLGLRFADAETLAPPAYGALVTDIESAFDRGLADAFVAAHPNQRPESPYERAMHLGPNAVGAESPGLTMPMLGYAAETAAKAASSRGVALVDGFVNELDGQIDAELLAQIQDRLEAAGALTGIFPGPFAAGLLVGAAKDLYDTLELVVTFPEVLAALSDTAHALCSPDGAEAAYLIGLGLGGDLAGEAEAFAAMDAASAAYWLGKKAGPLVTDLLVTVVTGGVATLGRRALPAFAKVVGKLDSVTALRRLGQSVEAVDAPRVRALPDDLPTSPAASLPDLRAAAAAKLGVPTKVGASPGRSIIVDFDSDAIGGVRSVRVTYGPDATPEDLLAHVATIEHLQRYVGLLGRLRALYDRWNGRLVPGQDGYDAWREVEKLRPMMEGHLERMAGKDASDPEFATLQADVADLEGQIARHEARLAALAPSQGQIAVRWTDDDPTDLPDSEDGLRGELASGRHADVDADVDPNTLPVAGEARAVSKPLSAKTSLVDLHEGLFAAGDDQMLRLLEGAQRLNPEVSVEGFYAEARRVLEAEGAMSPVRLRQALKRTFIDRFLDDAASAATPEAQHLRLLSLTDGLDNEYKGRIHVEWEARHSGPNARVEQEVGEAGMAAQGIAVGGERRLDVMDPLRAEAWTEDLGVRLRREGYPESVIARVKANGQLEYGDIREVKSGRVGAADLERLAVYARMARKKKPAIVDGFMTERVVLVLHRADALADKAVAAKVAELLKKHATLSVQWYDASGATQTYTGLLLSKFNARAGL